MNPLVLLTLCLGLSGAQVSSAAQPADPELAVELQVWYLEGGKQHIDDLGDDFVDVATAAGRLDMDGLNQACIELKADIDSAQTYRELPDAQAQEHWSDALAHYENSAMYCMEGSTGAPDAELLERSAAEAELGSQDFDDLTERVSEISGNTPPR